MKHMADRATIAATPRTVLGKQVRQLRRQGILPGNVYGKGLPSLAVQMDGRTFLKTVRAAGVRSMFELRVEGEPEPRFVVLRDLARKGGTGDPTHVDFFQVDLQRPIQTNVQIRLLGEAPAVRDLAGTLTLTTDAVAVRCLPLSIPEAIEVDLSSLISFDVSITVADLTPPPGVEVLGDPATVVVTVTPPRIRILPGEEQPGAEADEGEE
jgi:large subunit ribosomal protein L25